MLSIQNVEVVYNDVVLYLRGVSLEIRGAAGGSSPPARGAQPMGSNEHHGGDLSSGRPCMPIIGNSIQKNRHMARSVWKGGLR